MAFKGGKRRAQREMTSDELAASYEQMIDTWVPKTALGTMVKKKEITSMGAVMASGIPIKEAEIVEMLLPNMSEEVINVGRVQRTTDSGRRMRFRVTAATGNNNGYIGIGIAKGKEVGPTIRTAIKRAKMNIKEIKRGCGSWECGCGNPHTVPFDVEGDCGSVRVKLSPAPRGVGLIGSETAKKVLTLAGVSDAWVKSSGRARTTLNYAYAVLDALVNTNYMKLNEGDNKNLSIVRGATSKKEVKEKNDTKEQTAG